MATVEIASRTTNEAELDRVGVTALGAMWDSFHDFAVAYDNDGNLDSSLSTSGVPSQRRNMGCRRWSRRTDRR